MSDIFDEAAYSNFAENLPHALSGQNIRKVTMKQLRKPAIQHGRKAKTRAWGWRSMVSSRIGPKTVYLGSPSVRLPNPTALHQNIIRKAPEQLHKTLQLLRDLPMIHLRRQMCRNSEYNPICNLYMSVNDPKSHRIAYMWANTMSDVDPNRPGPEFTMIHIPEEHNMNQQVLTIPEHNINLCYGSDYMGEDKKGFLRQAMWRADELGMLGLHAGTKLVTVRDPHSGSLKKYGVYLFGLSATGKTTWSCHRLGLNEANGEGTEVIQDDIVFLKNDGSSYGAEANFFVKTDVDAELQEAMYNTLVHKSALYENVMIDANGNPMFLDERLCGNGRAVVQKNKFTVRRGKKMVSIAYPSFDLPPLDELDGIVFAFITRRNTIMSFSQELTPEQGVLAYLWGESTHSKASEPEKAGDSVRTVGTDPFIVGSRANKVNRFRDIVMDLVNRYPGKVRFFQYNTGGMGEIIKADRSNGKVKKTMIRKVERVPIPLMAAVQRGDLQGTNKYAPGRLGTNEVVDVAGFDMRKYNAKSFYDEEQIEQYIHDLVKGRRRFTQEIEAEGLDREISKWAEESFRIARSSTTGIPETEIKSKKISSIFRPLKSLEHDGGSSLGRLPRSFGWNIK